MRLSETVTTEIVPLAHGRTRGYSSGRPGSASGLGENRGAFELRRRRNAVVDLFYLAIGVIGFLVLWAVVKLCERV
jgi:hypothetical protein